MSWTEHVACRQCGSRQWFVKDGAWTSPCGQPMHALPWSANCKVCSTCGPSLPCREDCTFCWPEAKLGLHAT